MKGRLALAAMLIGSLTFLVSLYFEWLNTALCVPQSSQCYAGNLSETGPSGWSGYGQIAAVLAVALAAGAIAEAVDQNLATRLPLGRVAVAFGIFALLEVSEQWTSVVVSTGWSGTSFDTKTALGLGAYMGLAGAGIACAGAAVARWRGIGRPTSVLSAVGQFITLALIASFVLPALNAYEVFRGDSGVYICAFACLGLFAWHGRRPAPRLATAAATGVLVAAYLSPARHVYAEWPYELWLQLACAAGLLLLGLVGCWGLRFEPPPPYELAVIAASVLLVVSLFFPWQSVSGYGMTEFTQGGWSLAELAGVLALGLLVALVWARRFVRKLAIGAALYVLATALGMAIPQPNGIVPHNVPPPRLSVEYGALIGFAAAALLAVFGLGRVRPVWDKRLLVRLAPMLAALALLSFEVAPSVLNLGDLLGRSNLFAFQSPFVTLGVVAAIAMLLTIRLLLRWVEGPTDSTEIVWLPLALLALTTLAVTHDAIVATVDGILGPIYGKGISWEGWVSVFLCLLLTACGWVERRGAYPSAARTDGNASTTSLATSP